MTMARADAHSRVVGWLKVVLPLAALAILSTLFLVARRIDPEAALPYAEVDVEDLAREPRMTAPAYAGKTSDGAALTLSAEEARPAAEGSAARAAGLRLDLATPDGATTRLVAAEAVMEDATRQVLLSGGVTISTSSGYVLETTDMAVKLDRTGFESRSPVTATGPAGEIRADRLVLGQDNMTPGAYVLVFKGDVRLVYQPGG
jgi:lipopolysaccharide export system protein LptC